jgi:hypothetical protein
LSPGIRAAYIAVAIYSGLVFEVGLVALFEAHVDVPRCGYENQDQDDAEGDGGVAVDVGDAVAERGLDLGDG